MDETRLRSISEVANRLAVSRATVWRLIKDARIRSVRIGARVLVSDTEIARLIEQGTAGRVSKPSGNGDAI
jgi:excisionase family DNA binding protein